MHSEHIPKYKIRGIDLWGFRSMAQLLDYLFAGKKTKTGILVAMNAEKVLTIERDTQLRTLINEADYKYADGISIVRSIRRKYPEAQVDRIAGADLWEAIMERAGKENSPVFLVGGRQAVLERTIEQLRGRWNVNIVGFQDGYFTPEQRTSVCERIKSSGAAIVTVAMGSPRQELLMRDCRQLYPDALYMGVGGTYDVFVGEVKRAPKIWQKWGLEWLYRLIHQPSRLPRQLKLLKYLFYHFTRQL